MHLRGLATVGRSVVQGLGDSVTHNLRRPAAASIVGRGTDLFGGRGNGEGITVPMSHFHRSAWMCRATDPETAAAPASNKGQAQPAPSRVEKTVNSITLMGRVGGEPQMRGTTEHPVVVFSLATHANYNYQSGEMLQKTDWHRVCIFKPYLRDSVYKYMSKGQRVYVTGRLSYGEITDADGKTHTTTSVIGDDVIFISDSRNKAPPPSDA